MAGKAVLLERDGLPKIDPLMGGRFWPAAGGSWIDMALQRNCLAARHCLPKAGFASFHSRPTGRPISMARKRRPPVLSAEPVVLDAPGLHLFVRRGKLERNPARLRFGEGFLNTNYQLYSTDDPATGSVPVSKVLF
jgi:hypothetical protein